MKTLFKLTILIALLAGIVGLPGRGFGFDLPSIKGFVDLTKEESPIIQNDALDTEEGKLIRFKMWVYNYDFFYYYEPVTPLPNGAVLDDQRGEFIWVPDYSSAGTYTLTFKATEYYRQGINEDIWTEIKTITINVLDKPSGNFRIIPSATNGPAPFAVTFAMENIPEQAAFFAVKPFHVWWEFGDGGYLPATQSGNIYSNPGTYTVKVKITDDNFIPIAEAQTIISVEPEPTPLRTFYVSPVGSDTTGDGSKDNPWGSLQYALFHDSHALTAGDQLLVRGGTYPQGFDAFNPRWNHGLYGTSENPIWIKAYPGEKPIVNGTLGLKICKHIILEGFEAVGFGTRNSLNLTIRNNVFDGVSWINSPAEKFILLENNKITYAEQSYGALEHKGDYGIIRNNYIVGGMCNKMGPRYQQIYGNYFDGYFVEFGLQGTDALGQDRWLGDNVDSVFHDNILMNCPVRLYNTFRIAILNNTLVYNNTNQPAIWFYSHRLKQIEYNYYATYYGKTLALNFRDHLFLNNIFQVGANVMVYSLPIFEKDGIPIFDRQSFLSNYNLFWPQDGSIGIDGDTYTYGIKTSFNNYQSLLNKDLNSVIEDPQFVDTVFHLKPTSPAIDKGFALPVSFVDYEGNARPYGRSIDIGAYEYAGDMPTLPGDMDGDGDVDLQDLLIVAKGYGVTYDLQDLLLVAMHYGEKL